MQDIFGTMWHYSVMAATTGASALLARLRSAGSAFLTTLRRGRDPRARVADEFRPGELLRPVRAPMQWSEAYSWSLEAIMSARDQQMMGQFSYPVRLASAMRTDDALAVAYRARVAPARALGVKLKPAPGNRGERVAAEAEPLFGSDGVSCTRETVADIVGTFANHGVSVGFNSWTARDDGSRLDLVHQCWPLEFCSWDPIGRTLYTLVDANYAGPPSSSRRGSNYVDITHGDGVWTVYQSIGDVAAGGQPWTKDAAILSGALVWGRHAFGERDWAMGSGSQANAKIVGELPEGVPLQSTDPTTGAVSTSAEAAYFLALMRDIVSPDCTYGIKPNGAGLEWMTNMSRSFEVWERLCLSAEKAASRIYLGTDAILGSQGGAPGIDIAALFAIASTILQADLSAFEKGFREGALAPWAAVNFGSSELAPRRLYIVPDPDAQTVKEQQQKNEAAFTAASVARRSAGLEVTQETVDELAERYCVPTARLAEVLPLPPTAGQQPALRAA